MKINKEFIEKFKPCRNRWDNYLKYYSDFEGSWVDFLSLDRITSGDKLWVFSREIPLIESQQREFALMCAARAVDNCDIVEVQEFFNLVIYMVYSDDLSCTDSAAYRATYWAAYRAADRAADRAAYRAANWAAYRAANWAAYSVERDIQLEMVKMLMNDF